MMVTGVLTCLRCFSLFLLAVYAFLSVANVWIERQPVFLSPLIAVRSILNLAGALTLRTVLFF